MRGCRSRFDVGETHGSARASCVVRLGAVRGEIERDRSFRSVLVRWLRATRRHVGVACVAHVLTGMGAIVVLFELGGQREFGVGAGPLALRDMLWSVSVPSRKEQHLFVRKYR